MEVKDLISALGLKIFGGEKGIGNKITGGYVSDLLSDVMGNADSGQVRITLQTHKNVMAIASLKDLAAIVLINNNTPDEDTLEQSNNENIPMLGTSMSAFELTGKLYEILKSRSIV